MRQNRLEPQPVSVKYNVWMCKLCRWGEICWNMQCSHSSPRFWEGTRVGEKKGWAPYRTCKWFLWCETVNQRNSRHPIRRRASSAWSRRQIDTGRSPAKQHLSFVLCIKYGKTHSIKYTSSSSSSSLNGKTKTKKKLCLLTLDVQY